MRDADFDKLAVRPESFDAMLASCQPYLTQIAVREWKVEYRSKLAAADLVQNALARAYQKRFQYQGKSRQQLLGWLAAILRNEINTAYRRFSAEKRSGGRQTLLEPPASDKLDATESDSCPCNRAIENEEALALRAALERLPPHYRTVLWLRNWEQLPYDQVGRRMRRSTEAVKKLHGRAIARLKLEFRI